jgi:ribosomal protein S11
MFLKIILKKKYLFEKKKKYLFLYFITWLIMLRRNYSVIFKITYINFLKLIYYALKILLKIYKQFNFFFFNYSKNIIKNFKLKNKIFKTHNLISYIIKITILKSNIYINITNIKGTILLASSSGLIKLKGSQKTKQLAYNRIIKFTKFKIRKLKNKIFAIHFIGIKPKYNRKKILKNFKKYFKIKNVKYFNLIAHNGCRLKK